MHFIWVGKVQSCPRLHICITTNGHGNSIPLLNKDARYSLDRGKDPEYVCNTHQFLVKNWSRNDQLYINPSSYM